MPPTAFDPSLPKPPTAASVNSNRFNDLRGVKWRINLGILPSSVSSVDELRRITANSRRRYASLRRHLLVDPQISKGESYSPNPVIDNPLSQNPDSTWSRFFRNAELEKMVDQDLSRLYPEHGSYFQALGCQGTLRRVLLLWCLRHPDCGYRQGMHELLAPLLYVLHVDLERLSQVRSLHEDHFTDKFDGLSFEMDHAYNFNLNNIKDSMEDGIDSQGNGMKIGSLDELDPEIQTIILLSDAYGAEGELGIVLSEKFMEHDAYCMFDALMSGANGSVALADFFSPPPVNGSYNSLPPVIEASAAVYYLLSIVDSSLHNHLVELGVEPQYFALRWLRVLFGREFSLDDLLIIWDEIFASDNGKLDKSEGDIVDPRFQILVSRRGAFISAIAVSIILYLRSSLLATENATVCLQRLLNFPTKINLRKLIDRAKFLQVLALNINNLSPSPFLKGDSNRSQTSGLRGHSLSLDSVSTKTPISLVAESYWEEKWRVLQREEEMKRSSSGNHMLTRKNRWTERVRLRLSRTESDPFPKEIGTGAKDNKSSVRRSLLENLSQGFASEENIGKVDHHNAIGKKDQLPEVHVEAQETSKEDCTCISQETCFSGNAGGSEESSPIFSDPTSPSSEANEHENDSEKSSVVSNASVHDNGEHPQSMSMPVNPPLPVSAPPEEIPQKPGCNSDTQVKPVIGLKERLVSGKFQWLWKFGRNAAGEGPSERAKGTTKNTKAVECESNQSSATGSFSTNEFYSPVSSKGDVLDENVMGTLKHLGQSMLEHIQVIESVFQQDQDQVGLLDNFSKNAMVGKGQVKAMEALKELRQISNILSEMNFR